MVDGKLFTHTKYHLVKTENDSVETILYGPNRIQEESTFARPKTFRVAMTAYFIYIWFSRFRRTGNAIRWISVSSNFREWCDELISRVSVVLVAFSNLSSEEDYLIKPNSMSVRPSAQNVFVCSWWNLWVDVDEWYTTVKFFPQSVTMSRSRGSENCQIWSHVRSIGSGRVSGSK